MAAAAAARGTEAPRDRSLALDVATFATIATSIAMAVHGLRSRNVLDQSLWSEPAQAGVVALVLAACLASMQFLARRLAVPYSMLFAAALLFVASSVSGVGAVAALLAVTLGAFAAGDWVLRDAARDALGEPLAALCKVALGFALLSLAVFALALTPWNNPLVYLAMLAVPILVRARALRASGSAALAGWRAWSSQPQPAWGAVLVFLASLAVAIRFLAVLHPELGTDALAMHLVIADQLKADGTFHFDVTQSIWAVMPMAGDWALAAVHMLSDEAGARLSNFAADLMLVGMVFAAAWRLRSHAVALLAVAIYATTPLLFRESTTLYVENFWALWCFAALVLGVVSLRHGSAAVLVAAAMLVGVAFSAKVITLFFFLAFFLPIATAWVVRDWRSGLRKVAICAFVIAAVGIWPYVHAWLKTGNPVFPFFNQLFLSPFFETGKNFNNELFSPGPAWRMLFDATFESGRFLEGRPGAMGLMLFLVALTSVVGAVRETWLIRGALVAAVVFVLGVTHFQSYLRYLLPALPVLAVAIGASLAALASHSRASRFAVLVLVVVGAAANVYLTPASSWHYTALAFPPYGGSSDARSYRNAGAPPTFAVDVLNAIGTKRVLWFGDPLFGGATADVFATNWHGWSTHQRVAGFSSADEMARWVGSRQIGAVVVGPNPGAVKSDVVDTFLERDTTLLAAKGGVSVYLVREEVLFARELLENPGFDTGPTDWNGDPMRDGQTDTVEVTAERPLSQVVPVVAGSEYLLEVTARCDIGGAGYRLQVNWLGREGAFLGTNIDVKPCSGAFERHAMRAVAPEQAESAVVYASGHDTELAAEFDSVSFRR